MKANKTISIEPLNYYVKLEKIQLKCLHVKKSIEFEKYRKPNTQQGDTSKKNELKFLYLILMSVIYGCVQSFSQFFV